MGRGGGRWEFIGGGRKLEREGGMILGRGNGCEVGRYCGIGGKHQVKLYERRTLKFGHILGCVCVTAGLVCVLV